MKSDDFLNETRFHFQSQNFDSLYHGRRSQTDPCDNILIRPMDFCWKVSNPVTFVFRFFLQFCGTGKFVVAFYKCHRKKMKMDGKHCFRRC